MIDKKSILTSLRDFQTALNSAYKLRWWRLWHTLEVGKGTIFREMKYITTEFGPIIIGRDCVINAIALAGPIEIGDNTLINLYSDISGRDFKVYIGNNVLIAPRVSIMASMHNYQQKSELIRSQGTSGGDVVIGDDVWIGTNAVVLPGVYIGSGAVVGANAVVNKDIPQYAIAVGIPAKVIGYRE